MDQCRSSFLCGQRLLLEWSMDASMAFWSILLRMYSSGSICLGAHTLHGSRGSEAASTAVQGDLARSSLSTGKSSGALKVIRFAGEKLCFVSALTFGLWVSLSCIYCLNCPSLTVWYRLCFFLVAARISVDETIRLRQPSNLRKGSVISVLLWSNFSFLFHWTRRVRPYFMNVCLFIGNRSTAVVSKSCFSLPLPCTCFSYSVENYSLENPACLRFFGLQVLPCGDGMHRLLGMLRLGFWTGRNEAKVVCYLRTDDDKEKQFLLQVVDANWKSFPTEVYNWRCNEYQTAVRTV